MRQCIMAPIAIAFALGILASVYVSFAMCILIALGTAVILLAFMRTHKRPLLILSAAMFALGAARYSVSREIPINDISLLADRVTAFEGEVVSDPEARSGQIRIIIQANRAEVGNQWIKTSGSIYTNIYVAGSEDTPRPDYGDLIRIKRSPYIPMDPTNPGQFSWKDYLARQGIYSCASVRMSSDFELLNGHKGNAAMRAALWAKRQLEWSIGRVHPREQAGLITGMVLGTYSYLSPETFRNFTRTGTLHLLAASGANCYILLYIATPVLSLIKVMPKWRHLITIVLIILYLLMVGPKPSLVRAAVMSSLMLLALPLGRVANARNLFFAALFLVLLMDPADLFDVGFQLSFIAVWALIWISPILEEILDRAGIMPKNTVKYPRLAVRAWRCLLAGLASAAVCTSAVTLLTAPVVAYYFNYFSLVSLPANLALALGVTLVFADGLVSLITARMGEVGILIGHVGTWVTNAMLATVNYFGSLRWAAVSVSSPNTGMIAGYYLVLYSLMNYLRSSFAFKQK